MFRPRSNPSYFHKGLNDSNCVNNNNNLFEEMLEILPAKTTLIFLLQTLYFVIKEVTNNSSKREEFLGLMMNSVTMVLGVCKEKYLDISRYSSFSGVQNRKHRINQMFTKSFLCKSCFYSRRDLLRILARAENSSK